MQLHHDLQFQFINRNKFSSTTIIYAFLSFEMKWILSNVDIPV